MKLKTLLVCLVMTLVLAMGAGALAQGTITVQGLGSVQVESDHAGISLGVREVDSDVMTAQTRVNEKISAIVDAMKAMGLESGAISTNGIGIYPNYTYDDEGGETINSYSAYNNIYLTVNDVNNIGAYIDAAFAAGANSLDYVEFSASNTAEAANQALALAVDSAKAKAQTLAEAAGMSLGAILEIRDNADAGFDASAPYAKNAAAEEADTGTAVMAAKQTVSATVYITFALGE